MARNEEKAQSMLNRFIQRRPYLASECRDLADADRWRDEILRDIGVKVVEIQNESLGEHRLRNLNDEINKLLRERGHWERRILELGGCDYSRNSNAALMTDLDGNIVAIPNPSSRGPGYRYFGAGCGRGGTAGRVTVGVEAGEREEEEAARRLRDRAGLARRWLGSEIRRGERKKKPKERDG